MKIKYLLIILGILLFIGNANAWSSNQFNNSLTSENLNMTGSGEIVRYLIIPNSVSLLTNAYLNFSGYNRTGICYQESANVSTSCGGLNTGTYTFDNIAGGGWVNPTNMIDGDWNTYGLGIANSIETLYINYSKPTLSSPNGTIWQVKTRYDFLNISIPESCYNYPGKLQLLVQYYCPGTFCIDVARFWCFNGSGITGWNWLYTSSTGGWIYEEAIMWNNGTTSTDYSTYPTNTSLIIQNNAWNPDTTTYSDDYSTQGYLTEAYAYNSIGYVSGKIFSLPFMTAPLGNVTYKFTSPTRFYNANYNITIGGSETEGLANTSIWYSFNGNNFLILNWTKTTASTYNMKGSIPVNMNDTFYVRLQTDTLANDRDNPITDFSIEYSNYKSLPIGNTNAWNYTGTFDQTNNRTSNLASIISQYLTANYLIGNNYVIPFVFNSATIGILQYLDLQFNNNGILENSRTYNNYITSGTNQTFTINFTYDNVIYTNISGNLVYDGMNYPLILINQQTQSVSKIINIPEIINTANKSFYWTFTLKSASETQNFQTTSSSIQINPYSINFWFKNKGNSVNVTGYIDDLNKSVIFTGNNYTNYQRNLTTNLVFLRFINGIYNASINTWENKTQYYEYDNSIPYSINETVEIFSNPNTISYFQLQDNSQNLVQKVVIRLYGTIPNASGQTTYQFYGQRITDDNGQTKFNYNSEAELYMMITANGYQTKTIRLTASEINALALTTNGYRIIRLTESAYSGTDDIFIGGLYKYDGTYIKESKFDDVTKNYYMFVSDNYKRSLTYSTDSQNVNLTITLDGSNTGVINLLSGIQFDNSANSSFNVFVYANGVLEYTIPIIFEASTEVINIDVSGLYNNLIFRNMIFIGIILISMLGGLIIKTGEGDTGLHIFMISSLISPVIVGGLGWLSWCAGYFYISKLIKKWIGE